MHTPHTQDEQTLQRLFALFADAVQALANRDPVNVPEIHAEGRAVMRDHDDAVIRANVHKNRLSAPRHDYPRDDPFDPPEEEFRDAEQGTEIRLSDE